MRGGKRIALSVAAGLSLPAFFIAIFAAPYWAALGACIIIGAAGCTIFGYITYAALGD